MTKKISPATTILITFVCPALLIVFFFTMLMGVRLLMNLPATNGTDDLRGIAGAYLVLAPICFVAALGDVQ